MATHNGGPLYLDLVVRRIGWGYEITGVAHTTGWRPTRSWAKKAGKRRLRRLHRR
ncbi:hypothetical protein [Rhabdothermincola salaria]|uniref:hypothetical protein n=1 Tax=Rhabdothermincola salaria TaxID=2903142 RepID=UPI001E33ADE8|nr:hypothetical protein [Rhabdothermincola salaria]MCD9622800.1 hypothetical protein [Rhabdothermincola salaria]